MAKKDGRARAQAYQKKSHQEEVWYQEMLERQRAEEEAQKSAWQKRVEANKGKQTNPWPRRIVGLILGALLIVFGLIINFDPTFISERIYGWEIDFSDSTLKMFRIGGGLMSFIGLALVLISWKPQKRKKQTDKGTAPQQSRGLESILPPPML